jgi:PKD repeat protein
MTTTSNKASSVTKKASAVTLLMMTMVAGILFAAPSLSLAQQQQQTTTGTAPTTAPLTPEEQQEQDRLQRTTAAITQNLQQGQKQVNGIVYTPRWSEPVWVQPNALSLLFVYCLPGEFADSGQQILGGSEMEVLESYSLAVTNDLTGWLMVIENQNQTDRLPAAVGVICSSDLNEPETRVLSPQEQMVINNVIQQFITIRNTQITNITQVINIINNVTTNGTGGVTPPPPANDTGGTNGTGGVEPEPLRVLATWDSTDGDTAPATYRMEADATGGTLPYTWHWDFGDGQEANVEDTFHTYENPGSYNATATVTDATGQTASDSTQVPVEPAPTAGEPPTTNETGGETTSPPPVTTEVEEEEPTDGNSTG